MAAILKILKRFGAKEPVYKILLKLIKTFCYHHGLALTSISFRYPFVRGDHLLIQQVDPKSRDGSQKTNPFVLKAKTCRRRNRLINSVEWVVRTEWDSSQMCNCKLFMWVCLDPQDCDPRKHLCLNLFPDYFFWSDL